ncbi:MAG TPA: polynucleotide kinase-phosphatase [Patescibacteria group bacterium]|nr:polynucleotide kinase-phosphatase [Patescibacteria group bacterium]
MKIELPEFCLVVLIGASGSGKSTFARKHFLQTEILSSDYCRGLVSDDENNQAATKDAFDVLQYIASKRLSAKRLTVIDATNVQPEARKSSLALAQKYHCHVVAIVLDMPEKVCLERNSARPDRNFGAHVIPQQRHQLRRSLKALKREGFRFVYVLDSPEAVENVQITRKPLWNNRADEHGPFDIIGDIHGCYGELEELLLKLGYEVLKSENGAEILSPHGRKVIFLGDLVDRGPKTPEVLELVMNSVRAGTAMCVPGNHDIKLMKKLTGRNVKIAHGLAESLEQLEKRPKEFSEKAAKFIDSLVSHYVLDDEKLIVAHAGMKEELQGRASGKVRDFALFGETTGETDEFGLPVRLNWAAEYRGKSMVVYGHTPVPEAVWLNNTINLDTGCVFGGKLTALRYPEREIMQVDAREQYAVPSRPIGYNANSLLSAQQETDDILDIADVSGKRIIETGLHHTVIIREENSIAALELMSRFAVNPKWLMYLPPTMSPSETSKRPDYLEHIEEALEYFKKSGVSKVICEEKHMGSRAVVIVCHDNAVAQKRFGITGEEIGVCYTRTGRPFFTEKNLEKEFLKKVSDGMEKSGLWDVLKTDWICLDCELLPWSAKAQELLKTQYAAVGTAAKHSLSVANDVLKTALANSVDVGELSAHFKNRQEAVEDYTASYRNYCWPVDSLQGIKLAPFHILATEGALHVDEDHLWHMETIAQLCETDTRFFLKTAFKIVDFEKEESVADAMAWWESMTNAGGEGAVVKPLSFVTRGKRGLIQPAVKCRGREYLRIIYGPEYDFKENLERLRSRGLSAKRSLALREFALGIEAMERFVAGEPLRRVHECVFGVLALESEPVDPRL